MATIAAGTRASIRRQVGRTLYPRLYEFLYGATSAAGATTFTLDGVRVVPDDALVGRLAYFSDGPALGQVRMIVDSVQASGICTVSPAFSPAPVTGNTVEIWPDYIDIETINDHINLAIDRIGEAVGIYVEQLAIIDTDRQVIDLPTTWTHLVGVRYMDSYEKWWDYFPSGDPWQDTLGAPTCMIRGGFVYLNRPIDGGVTSIYIRGYRPPVYLATDAAIPEVNPAYLVYMTAYSLSAGMSYGQALDPEQHSARATNWYNQAKDIELKSQTSWVPHTVPVQT